MAPKFHYVSMDKDDEIWEKLEEEEEKWLATTIKPDVFRAVGRFMLRHRRGKGDTMHPVRKGGYNLAYRGEYADGHSIVMKVPIPGIFLLSVSLSLSFLFSLLFFFTLGNLTPTKVYTPFAEEKIRYEAETMRYIAAHTTIPVPHVYRHGTAAENPTGLGPFIIMDWIDHENDICDAHRDPSRPVEQRSILDPAVDEARLERLYRQVADIFLQLQRLKFPRIGSLSQRGVGGSQVGDCGATMNGDDNVDSTTHKLNDLNITVKEEDDDVESTIKTDDNTIAKNITVAGRPLIQSMAQLIVHNHLPTKPSGTILPVPEHTYTSSRDWFVALTDMHLAAVVFQRNDCVKSEEDARDKFVARQLLRNLARDNKLVIPTTTSTSTSSVPGNEAEDGNGKDEEEFRLFSEDLRPANILLDKDENIVGIIDWEFVYAAPAQFSFDPPWWLLIMKPDDWPVSPESEDGQHEGDWWCSYKAWMKVYEPRLETFLRVLREQETKIALTKEEEESGSRKEIPLSQRMKESWDSGDWILSYALRDFWAFDYLWWTFLDERFFGPNEERDHKARLDLLTDAQRKVMEEFVERKMREKEEGGIAHWTEEEAAAVLKKFMV